MIKREHVEAYDRDGFVIVDDFFSKEVIDILIKKVEAGERVTKQMNMPDAEGRSSKLSLWMDLTNDVFGSISGHPRLVNSVRALLREDVYHWHSKVMLKEAKVGGAWEWHQDYGYWYHDGCPTPRLVSCMIALDEATRENGCLKVIVGSHNLGRIEHGRYGSQAGAHPDRVKLIAEKYEVRYCEAKPGSALFFHSNTLHASEANLSDRPRRAYICCYNAFSNLPLGNGGHGKPMPIPQFAEDAVLAFG
jgi:hypothetical protein